MFYLIITLVLSFICVVWKKDENPVIEFKNVSKHFGPTQALHISISTFAQGETRGDHQAVRFRVIDPAALHQQTGRNHLRRSHCRWPGRLNDPKVYERLIRQEAGMVFRSFQPLPASDGAGKRHVWPATRAWREQEEAEKLARELLAKVGLAERAHHYPSELSGGHTARGDCPRAGGEAENDAV